MDHREMMSRFQSATVATLATGGVDGRPHIVPVCFAVDEGVIYFAVDSKPKRTVDLQRLRNIAANPAVSVLIHHYEDDWSRLWWVRVDGDARVVTDEGEAQKAVKLLAARYSQYRASTPAGPVVAIAIGAITGWSAT